MKSFLITSVRYSKSPIRVSWKEIFVVNTCNDELLSRDYSTQPWWRTATASGRSGGQGTSWPQTSSCFAGQSISQSIGQRLISYSQSVSLSVCLTGNYIMRNERRKITQLTLDFLQARQSVFWSMSVGFLVSLPINWLKKATEYCHWYLRKFKDSYGNW